MKGYKAFDKGLVCRGFQFKEGETYKEDKAKICEKGFHFCLNPLDTLDYYNLCGSEFAEVESLGKVEGHKEDTKHTTTEIKIGAKISLKQFVEASVVFLLEICKSKKKDSSKLASSGDYSKLASSGYYSKLASSGDYSKLASSGYYSKLASSGYYSKLASSGYYSKLASSGDYSKLASSGDYSQLASSGYYSQLASSGYYSKLASSGYYSQLELNGQDSVGANIGINGSVKGKKGNWITLAEWIHKDNKWKPINVRSIKIDGKKIKEDVWYKLEDGEFKEQPNDK